MPFIVGLQDRDYDHRPDEDSVTQICLLANHVNMLMCGINVPHSSTVMNDGTIEEIKVLCLNLGLTIML